MLLRLLRLTCWTLGAILPLAAAEVGGPLAPVVPDDPNWRQLGAALAERVAVEAHFSEQRFFPFRKEPVLVGGMVRIAGQRGLSLEYRTPNRRILIVDAAGM